MSGCSSEAVLQQAWLHGAVLCKKKKTQTLSKNGESGDVYLAHLEQMLSVTLACGSGW